MLRKIIGLLWVITSLFTISCSFTQDTILPTSGRPKGGFGLGWLGSDTLRLEIEIPPELRMNPSFVELIVSLNPTLRPPLWQGQYSITPEQAIMTIPLPAELFPVGTPFYWQAFWVNSRHMGLNIPLEPQPVQILLESEDQSPTLILPAAQDEVPADTLVFRFQPSPEWTGPDIIYRVQIAQQENFQTILYSWEVPGQQGIIAISKPGILHPGTYYWRVYAIRKSEQSLTITKFHKNRFQVISGCGQWNQGRYAYRVVETHYECLSRNRYTDPSQALGSPDARELGEDTFSGITSLGVNGYIILEMGRCVKNGSGADIRVYQTVSYEGVEVQVAESRQGPWVSLGMRFCGETTPGLFSNHCDFDLSDGALSQARFVKVIDHICNSHPYLCGCNLQTVQTPGADIDAVEALH